MYYQNNKAAFLVVENWESKKMFHDFAKNTDTANSSVIGWTVGKAIMYKLDLESKQGFYIDKLLCCMIPTAYGISTNLN